MTPTKATAMDEFEEMARYYDSEARFHIERGAHGHAARSERTAALLRRASRMREALSEIACRECTYHGGTEPSGCGFCNTCIARKTLDTTHD